MKNENEINRRPIIEKRLFQKHGQRLKNFQNSNIAGQ